MSSAQSPDDKLLASVNSLIAQYHCQATELGPDAVAVMGDGRVVGASVFVTFPADVTSAFCAMVSTQITNKVPGITRVMMNIPLPPPVVSTSLDQRRGPGSALPRFSQKEFDEFEAQRLAEDPNYKKTLYERSVKEFDEKWGIDPNTPTSHEW